MSVTYNVVNHGENAYLPHINITSSNRMPFSKIPFNCNLDTNVLVCSLNQGQAMAQGKELSITVVYDVSNLKGDNMILTAEVFSSGKESVPSDNIIKDVVTLKKFTEIEIVGYVVGRTSIFSWIIYIFFLTFSKHLTPHINLEKITSKSEQINNSYEVTKFYELV